MGGSDTRRQWLQALDRGMNVVGHYDTKDR